MPAGRVQANREMRTSVGVCEVGPIDSPDGGRSGIAWPGCPSEEGRRAFCRPDQIELTCGGISGTLCRAYTPSVCEAILAHVRAVGGQDPRWPGTPPDGGRPGFALSGPDWI